MKIELYNLKNETIFEKKYVFIYGNFSEIADLLQKFLIDIYKVKTVFHPLFSKATDFIKSNLTQESLFDSSLYMHRITDLIDSQITSFDEKMKDNQNKDVFIVTPGDFRKSKKVTEYFLKSDQWITIPVFKTDSTYNSIIKFFLHNIDKKYHKHVFDILTGTSENLYSIITKLNLLQDLPDSGEIISDQNNTTSGFDPISLLRYLSSVYMKNKEVLSDIIYKKNGVINNEKLLNICLKEEIDIKRGYACTNDMILQEILKI